MIIHTSAAELKPHLTFQVHLRTCVGFFKLTNLECQVCPNLSMRLHPQRLQRASTALLCCSPFSPSRDVVARSLLCAALGFSFLLSFKIRITISLCSSCSSATPGRPLGYYWPGIVASSLSRTRARSASLAEAAAHREMSVLAQLELTYVSRPRTLLGANTSGQDLTDWRYRQVSAEQHPAPF